MCANLISTKSKKREKQTNDCDYKISFVALNIAALDKIRLPIDCQ